MSATDDGGSLGKPVREILQILSTIPLLSADDLAALCATWSGARLDEDGSALARELVRQGKVTKYQAAALYQGQPKGLAVADYLFLDRLGAGATGTVYKARRRGSDEVFAVKVLNSAALRSPDAVKRFQREAETAIRLNHPNIARALEAGESEGRRFMVMELLEGIDLSSYAKKKGPLPAEEAVRYVVSAARGLAHAHEQGIVHRDVKPGNLLVLGDGRIKVLDLGLARLADPDGTGHDEGLTQTGQVMGTIDYMAPEQALATRNADARADVYGLGCTLYRLITGDIPYPGDSMVAKILSHRDSPVPSLRAKKPKTPAAVDYVLARMLAKRPENRYQTMNELVGDLELSISPEAGRLRPPAPETAPPQLPAPPPGMAGAASTAAPFPMLISSGPASAGGSSMFNTATSDRPAAGRKSWPLLLATTVVTCVAVLFALKRFGPQESPEPPSEPLAAAESTESTVTATPPTATSAASSAPALPATPVGTSPSDTASSIGASVGPTSPPAARPVVVIESAGGQAMNAGGSSGPATPTPTGLGAPSSTPSGTAVASVTPADASLPSGGAPVTTAAATAPPPADARRTVPDNEALAQAVKVIREDLYRAEYGAAQTPAARAKLAETLGARAQELLDDPVGRYAMLREARDMAVEAGGVLVAADVAARAAAEYHVEEIAWLVEGMERVVAGTPTPTVARQLAAMALWKLEPMSAAGSIGVAERLLACATAATRRAQDSALTKFAADRQKQFAKVKGEREAAEKVRAALVADPENPAANLAEGKRLALVEGKWAEGFKHLAKGSDAVLRELAEKSLAAPTETDARLALGDLWWDRAGGATGRTKRDLQEGALYWYRQVRGQLTGLTGDRVEKRMMEVRAAVAAAETAGGTLPQYVRLPLNASMSMPLRLIQPGIFVMGSPESEPGRAVDERRHLVVISKPFYLGVTEVSDRQWEALTGRSRNNSDPDTPYGGVDGTALNLFMDRANGGTARSYLRARLPTEAEWEYAARAGTTAAYPWGEHPSNYWEHAALGTAQPIGGRKPNGWGLHDMAGNVSEYCADVYVENIGDGLAVDPKGPPMPARPAPGTLLEIVVRGGAYSSSIDQLRAARRGKVDAKTVTFSAGLRIACDVIGTIPAGAVLHEPPVFKPATTTLASSPMFGSTPSFTPPAVTSPSGPTTSGAPASGMPVGSTLPVPSPQGVRDVSDLNAHRALAEWVVQRGGNVIIYHDSRSMSTTRLETLRDYGPYRVRSVNFYNSNVKLATDEIRYIAGHSWLTQLTLTEQTLTPEAANALTQLTSLTSLMLNRTRIDDAGLQALGRMAALNILYLDGCPLTDASLEHLFGLTRVTSLHLERTQVTDAGLATIAKMSWISGLYLEGCSVSDAGIRHLLGMTRLQMLNVDGTQVTDAGLADIGRMTWLTSLSLDDCPVTDAGLRQLSGLRVLNVLNLERTKVTDSGLAQLAALSSLSILHLNGCSITGAGFGEFKCPGLVSLYLDDTQVNDVGLARLQLPVCNNLSLRRCKVTDAVIGHLSTFPKLRYLYAYETQITQTGADRLRRVLPDVKVYTR